MSIDHLFAHALSDNEATRQHLVDLMRETRKGALFLHRPGIRDCMQPLEGPIVRVEDRYYLKRCYDLEQTVHNELTRLSFHKPMSAPIPMDLNAAQQEAFTAVLTHTVTLISGGPGTGKSYLAKHIATLFPRTILTAPTGKAASRLGANGTLHKLLGLPYDCKPIIADLIIVDECSMIDAKLFASLLSSIPTGTRLVLMGDPYQLPPVEGGHIFPDLFSLPLPQVHLTESLRSDRAGILALASAIRSGAPITQDLFSRHNDIALVPYPKTPPIPIHPSTLILSPFKELASVYNTYLNEHKSPHLKTPIICTKNDYKTGHMNGETGWLEEGPTYPFDLAFALTVHKSQGSEYDHILLLLPETETPYDPRLLYTAVTRAKKTVTIAANSLFI